MDPFLKHHEWAKPRSQMFNIILTKLRHVNVIGSFCLVRIHVVSQILLQNQVHSFRLPIGLRPKGRTHFELRTQCLPSAHQKQLVMSRPSHNLSGNGRAATSRDTGMTNRDLGASRGSDERLRAGRARRSHLSHEVTCELTWSCESRLQT